MKRLIKTVSDFNYFVCSLFQRQPFIFLFDISYKLFTSVHLHENFEIKFTTCLFAFIDVFYTIKGYFFSQNLFTQGA